MFIYVCINLEDNIVKLSCIDIAYEIKIDKKYVSIVKLLSF